MTSDPVTPAVPAAGRPVWQALVALVLVPLLVACGLGATLLHSSARRIQDAESATRLLVRVVEVDAARQAVDAEVLPTLQLAALATAVTPLEVISERSEVALVVARASLRDARRDTDAALARIGDDGAFAVGAAAAARAHLQRARALVDEAGGLSQVQASLARASAELAGAERRLTAQALARTLSASTASALQDVSQSVDLSAAASQQLPLLYASRLLPGDDGDRVRAGWVAAWGSYTALSGRGGDLSSAELRSVWHLAVDDAEVAAFSELLRRQALAPQEQVVLTGAVAGLAHRSLLRDQVLSTVLTAAVSAAQSAAHADATDAAREQRQLLALCLGLFALSVAMAWLSARWLGGSVVRLAAAASMVSRGEFVDVPLQGPRELRVAARVLAAAVAGLQRVQEQARALADGDLERASHARALPGPLGDALHASVEQVVAMVRAREELQQELFHQASYDGLTGLPNRAQSLRHLTGALHRAARSGRRTAVLFIDLDGFKAVNDTLGHACGDEVLRVVAARLQDVLRGGDVVGRLGGDEFVVVIEDCAEPALVVALAERLITAVSQPLQVEGRTAAVGASIGIAVSQDGGTDADPLLAQADAAAYRAKSLGRGRAEVFDAALSGEIEARTAMEADLRRDLAGGSLRLHYQPVVDAVSGTVHALEALARWDRPGHGPVRPDVFIAVAESSSLVCDLGRWVLGESLAQLAAWRAEGLAEGVRVAVNISGRHLADPRVLRDVAWALESTGLPGRDLVVEITETVLVDDPRSGEHLRALREQGVLISIDDFGTGYASVGALQQTPADALKIDRSFVATDDAGRHQLAELIVKAATTFEMYVVAEGVETEEQRRRVVAAGCTAAQGWLFARAEAPDHPPLRAALSPGAVIAPPTADVLR